MRRRHRDSTNLGNVVAALHNVPLRCVQEAAQQPGLIGEALVKAGHINRTQLEEALTSQRALRGGLNVQREILRELLRDIKNRSAEIRELAGAKP